MTYKVSIHLFQKLKLNVLMFKDGTFLFMLKLPKIKKLNLIRIQCH